jgi:hypothetical protein
VKALSIRQPWAWLIVNGFKDIENRSWDTRYRGTVLIHASKGMTRAEYEAAKGICESLPPLERITMPPFEKLERGGIVGYAHITGTTRESESPWFFGPVGFQLVGAKPLPFQQLKGRLSFFETGYDVVAAGRTEALISSLQPQRG